MIEYSQGILEDAAAILADGQRVSVEEIVKGLNEKEQLKARLAAIKQASIITGEDYDGETVLYRVLDVINNHQGEESCLTLSLTLRRMY